MTAPGDPPDVFGSACYLMIKAGHYIGIEIERALGEFTLTTREFLVLSFARTEAGLSQQALAERLRLDPTIVVSIVDALEQRRLLERRKDPADRRRNVLSLTARGISLHDAASTATQAAEDDFLALLTSAQRERLGADLRRILVPRLPWLADHG